MKSKPAAFSFLAICLVLAFLLLTGIISFETSGIVFALALVVFGVLSRGFRNKGDNQSADA